MKEPKNPDQHSHHQGSYAKFFAIDRDIDDRDVSPDVFEFISDSRSRLVQRDAFFMTLIMGGAMIVIMLVFMRGMYGNRKANMAIFGGGFMLIGSAVWLVRSQVTVTGLDYMEGMIPHHSIAILTSERAGIKDLRVRKLADGIIRAQKREIKEMECLIRDIRENGVAADNSDANTRPVPEFDATPE